MRRYLDPKNIPKTPSQEVFGRLGTIATVTGWEVDSKYRESNDPCTNNPITMSSRPENPENLQRSQVSCLQTYPCRRVAQCRPATLYKNWILRGYFQHFSKHGGCNRVRTYFEMEYVGVRINSATTPPKTNMEPKKNGGLGRCVSFSKGPFSGSSLQGVYHQTYFPTGANSNGKKRGKKSVSVTSLPLALHVSFRIHHRGILVHP